jgi:hypothetical protein
MVPIPIFLSSFYSMYVLYTVALPHSLAGEGAGSPKSYDGTETLVPVLTDNIHCTVRIHKINADLDPAFGKSTLIWILLQALQTHKQFKSKIFFFISSI